MPQAMWGLVKEGIVIPQHPLPEGAAVRIALGEGATLEDEFRSLADAWLTQTAHVSASSDQVAHPAFQAIVQLGPPVIPLLLRALATRTGPWHRALRRVTGVDPVPAAGRGNFDQAVEAWLRWGKEHGYTW